MIVLIIVVVAFVNRAGELNLNKWIWGGIGFAAYGGTQVGLAIIAGLAIEMQGQELSESAETVLNFAAILASGIVAYTVYHRMPSYVANEREAKRENLLDDDIFR